MRLEPHVGVQRMETSKGILTRKVGRPNAINSRSRISKIAFIFKSIETFGEHS